MTLSLPATKLLIGYTERGREERSANLRPELHEKVLIVGSTAVRGSKENLGKLDGDLNGGFAELNG